MPPIAKNGKAEFDKALPINKGGHVLALRESHEHTAHVNWIDQHLSQLKHEHRVGAIGLESPSYMMLFDWAYKDGKLGNPANATQLYTNVQTVTRYEARREALQKKALLVQHAQEKNLQVIRFDVREGLLLSERAKHFSEEIARLEGYAEAGPVPIESITNVNDKQAWVVWQAKQLYDRNPDYKRRIDAIESTVLKMRERGIPADVISATVAAQLSDPARNMITLSGAAHLNGLYSELGQVDGIFDNGLASYRTVTDAWIGSRSGLQEHIAMMQQEKGDCYSFDHIGFIYLCDRDVVAKPPVSPSHHFLKQALKKASVGMTHDVLSCVDAPPVEQVFTPEQLDPRRVPQLDQAITEMRNALQPKPDAPRPAAPDNQGTVIRR